MSFSLSQSLFSNTCKQSIGITMIGFLSYYCLETTCHLSMITMTLSKKELDTSSTGYQSPLPADQVKPLNEFEDDGAPVASPRTQGRRRDGQERVGGREISYYSKI
ncbi:uncharacterized protein LOC111299806 [Durio zibethinus]|uniref:Uncharacterized protein LOC111299806 n=1 Tax=Durio zibethinus TaxID=66656 RepID=A0A6P5ZER4_DURZI|nr:uncharacterized protein LOC111299806 [Durio zibethinus]